MEKFPKAFLLGAATAAHQAARTVIREICPHAKVGLTLSLHDIQTVPGGEELAAQKWELEFRHYLPAIRDDDFLGVQNYTRSVIGPGGELPVPEEPRQLKWTMSIIRKGLFMFYAGWQKIFKEICLLPKMVSPRPMTEGGRHLSKRHWRAFGSVWRKGFRSKDICIGVCWIILSGRRASQ